MMIIEDEYIMIDGKARHMRANSWVLRPNGQYFDKTSKAVIGMVKLSSKSKVAR